MSNLDKLLTELYPNQISEADAKEASSTLIGFFKELQKANKTIEQEKLIQKEKRDFISTLSVLPEIDWNNKIDELPIEQQYKDAMKDKLAPYLEKFQNPVDIDTDTTVF